MSLFDDLIANETITSVRTFIVETAQAADLPITNWISGGVGEQMVQAWAIAAYVKSLAISAAVRGYVSLDTSTDPGDPDPYDPTNEDLEAAPGFLSNKGENDFGTPRREATFASGFWTFDNTAGTNPRTFAPGALTVTWTEGTPPNPAPTYRNTPDAAIYTDGGTVTVPPGASLVIPIAAEEVGSRSNAPPAALTLTTVLSGVTGTNAAPVTGTDRESAEDYRVRCRQAAARVSLAGPSAAYEYLAQTNLDGTPLLNASGNPVNTTRVQVSQESSTGIADAFFASPAGAATTEDVTAANDNIEAESFAVPDTITYTGVAATEIVVAVAGTAKLRNIAGADVDEAKAAIVAALGAALSAYPVGGRDQTPAGDGVLYTHDMQAEAACSYPGLYDLLVTTPAGSSTPLLQGEVAVLSTTVGDWTVTLV
jgi:Baseplate J-like protein